MTQLLALLALIEAAYIVFASWRANRFLKRKSEEITKLLDIIQKRLTHDDSEN